VKRSSELLAIFGYLELGKANGRHGVWHYVMQSYTKVFSNRVCWCEDFLWGNSKEKLPATYGRRNENTLIAFCGDTLNDFIKRGL
jgi:hypothetical protein